MRTVAIALLLTGFFGASTHAEEAPLDRWRRVAHNVGHDVGLAEACRARGWLWVGGVTAKVNLLASINNLRFALMEPFVAGRDDAERSAMERPEWCEIARAPDGLAAADDVWWDRNIWDPAD